MKNGSGSGVHTGRLGDGRLHRPLVDDITGVCAVFVPEGLISQGTG